MKTKWRALQLAHGKGKVRNQAMEAGIRALGGEVIDGFSSSAHYDDNVQFAFTSGMLESEAEEREHLAMIGVPLIVMDCGYFNRAKGPHDPYGYNQVGFNALHWVPPGECPSDRYDALKLPPIAFPRGLSIHPTNPRRTLVLGQVPNDTQHGMSAENLGAWLRGAAQKYQLAGSRIIYRPHPKAKGLKLGTEDEYQTPDIPLSEGLKYVDRVVTYNSTAGLEAIAAGVGVTCSINAHYYRISGYGFDLCTKHQVLAYFHKLAYAQWTTGELATGEPLKFLNTIRRILPCEYSSPQIRPAQH